MFTLVCFFKYKCRTVIIRSFCFYLTLSSPVTFNKSLLSPVKQTLYIGIIFSLYNWKQRNSFAWFGSPSHVSSVLHCYYWRSKIVYTTAQKCSWPQSTLCDSVRHKSELYGCFSDFHHFILQFTARFFHSSFDIQNNYSLINYMKIVILTQKQFRKENFYLWRNT